MKRAQFLKSLLLLLPLATLVALPAGAAEQQVSITGISSGYNPRQVTIVVGDTVTWKNNDGMEHTATSSGEFDSGRIQPGRTFSHTFTRQGVFNYNCTVGTHGLTMQGTVTVTPAGTSSQPPSPTSPPAQTNKPSPSPTPSKSPTPSPTPSESPTPSPREVVTGTVDSAPPIGDPKDDGDLSGGAIAAIVAGVVAVGSGIGLFLMRRTPA